MLQSRSKTYPFVDTFTYRHYFVRDLGLLEDGHYKIANFDLLLNECAANNSQHDGIRIPNGSFCRYQFIELCIKMAKFLYSTGYMFREGGKHKARKSCDDFEEENFEEVSIHRAFFTFVEEMLKPYYMKVRRDFSDFREDKLWDQ